MSTVRCAALLHDGEGTLLVEALALRGRFRPVVKSRVESAGARRLVLALGGVAVCGDQFQHCVECGLERLRVAFDLGEEQAAL